MSSILEAHNYNSKEVFHNFDPLVTVNYYNNFNSSRDEEGIDPVNCVINTDNNTLLLYTIF